MAAIVSIASDRIRALGAWRDVCVVSARYEAGLGRLFMVFNERLMTNNIVFVSDQRETRALISGLSWSFHDPGKRRT
jgi:hypothetical protein